MSFDLTLSRKDILGVKDSISGPLETRLPLWYKQIERAKTSDNVSPVPVEREVACPPSKNMRMFENIAHTLSHYGCFDPVQNQILFKQHERLPVRAPLAFQTGSGRLAQRNGASWKRQSSSSPLSSPDVKRAPKKFQNADLNDEDLRMMITCLNKLTFDNIDRLSNRIKPMIGNTDRNERLIGVTISKAREDPGYVRIYTDFMTRVFPFERVLTTLQRQALDHTWLDAIVPTCLALSEEASSRAHDFTVWKKALLNHNRVHVFWAKCGFFSFREYFDFLMSYFEPRRSLYANELFIDLIHEFYRQGASNFAICNLDALEVSGSKAKFQIRELVESRAVEV